MKNLSFVFLILFFTSCAVQNNQNSTHKYDDAHLRGANTEFRNWWNVQQYRITVEPNFDKRFIKGNVEIDFTLEKEMGDFLQIDLQEPMQIKQVMATEIVNDSLRNYAPIPLASIIKQGDHYLIPSKFLKTLKKLKAIKILFEGEPKQAKQAPWDGGWIFTKDLMDRPWMAVAVQGLGASAWFPCKDYQGDEPDFGASLSIIVPGELVAVGNGELWKSSFVKNEAGKNVYTWQVVNPINTYNITPNIGYYKHWGDEYDGVKGKLQLNYYVLDYNLNKAKPHFEQVKSMLKVFEDWFGPYPFYDDGYKLVETPFVGMEHQSNIAYGNAFANGYLGEDRSKTGWAKKFDYIIVHESAHEWFGNNITTEQVADLWVHEAFATYAEVIYVQEMFGEAAANEYVQGLRGFIKNDKALVGLYDVHQAGSYDMYNKGVAMLHTLRAWMNDDEKFKRLLKNMNTDFYHTVVTGDEIEKYIAKETGLNLQAFFNQYLRTIKVPVLELKKENNKTLYRWNHVVEDFKMPIQMNDGSWLRPSQNWKETEASFYHKNINANFYVKVKKM